MRYHDVKRLTKEEVESIMDRCRPEELAEVPIAVSLYDSNSRWAQLICINLSCHSNPTVRGNAVLGFGHLARRFGKLDFLEIIKGLVEDALEDSDQYVRGQANAAADDFEHFLACRVTRRNQDQSAP